MALYIYFGVPGSGKTTHAASVVYRNLKKGFPTFSNVEIKGAFLYDPLEDFGKYEISYCDVLIDEAAIDFNNRKTRSLSQVVIAWLKKYRHHHVRDIYVYSQSYDDMDITIRRLADQLVVIRKSAIPWLAVLRRIQVSVGPDENHQMCDQYSWAPGLRLLWLPRYWRMFDSWEAAPLDDREFECVNYGSTIDRTPGNRQLRGLKKLIDAEAKRDAMRKFRHLFAFLKREEAPVHDAWIEAMEQKALDDD